MYLGAGEMEDCLMPSMVLVDTLTHIFQAWYGEVHSKITYVEITLCASAGEKASEFCKFSIKQSDSISSFHSYSIFEK